MHQGQTFVGDAEQGLGPVNQLRARRPAQAVVAAWAGFADQRAAPVDKADQVGEPVGIQRQRHAQHSRLVLLQFAGADVGGIDEIDRDAEAPQPRVPAAHVVHVVEVHVIVAGLKEVVEVFVDQQRHPGPGRLTLRKEMRALLHPAADVAGGVHPLRRLAVVVKQAEAVAFLPEALGAVVPETDAGHAAGEPRQHPAAHVGCRRRATDVQ